MPLPANSTLTLRAQLIVPAGIVVNQLQAVANAFTLTSSDETPQVVEIGRGAPASDGALVIAVTLPGVLAGEVYPRIQLGFRLPRSRALRVIAEIPATPRGATIDFGIIEIRQESLFAIGDTTFFGFSKEVLDRLGGGATGTAAELQKQIEALNEQLRQITAQLATATAKNAELQQTNAGLRSSLETASRELAAVRESAAVLTRQVEDLNGQIAALTAEKAQLEAQLTLLNVRTTDQQQANDKLREEAEATRQSSAAATAAAAAFQAQTEALNSQLNGRVLQLNTHILQLNDQILTLESQNRALAAERQTLHRVNTDLTAELTTAQQQRTAAEAAVNDLKETINTRATLGSLVENVSTQLRSAQETLAGTGSPFKLGRLSMELKVLPSEHGTEFNFPTRDEVQRTSGDHLSVLSVDFTPVTPVELPGLPPAAAVPDLTGTTEVMARRLAAAAGYGLQTGFLAVPRAESGVSQAGRVVKQIPAPGDASAPGSIITVLLGKEE